LDIDFWLVDPGGVTLAKAMKQSTGTTTVTAKADGRHEYCFSNTMSTVTDKVLRLVNAFSEFYQDVEVPLASTFMVWFTSMTTNISLPLNAKFDTWPRDYKPYEMSRNISSYERDGIEIRRSRRMTVLNGGRSRRPLFYFPFVAGRSTI